MAVGIQAVTEVRFINFPNHFISYATILLSRSEGSDGLIVAIMVHSVSPTMMCVLAIPFPAIQAQGLGLSMGSQAVGVKSLGLSIAH